MELKDFFREHDRLALAFSGGADSAYLMYAAAKNGADITAYYVRSQFQPEFEYQDALRLADELGVRLRVLSADVLSDDNIASNPPERCYHCKKRIMGLIKSAAAQDGYDVIVDGTNASDDGADRPGMRVLREYGILSPLRFCGITKPKLRELSRAAGLFTWDKPAYACLATRIKTGERITAQKLTRAEESENFLFSLGFTDFRVRCDNDCALLQFTAAQLPAAHEKSGEILRELGKRFSLVRIDDNPREASV